MIERKTLHDDKQDGSSLINILNLAPVRIKLRFTLRITPIRRKLISIKFIKIGTSPPSFPLTGILGSKRSKKQYDDGVSKYRILSRWHSGGCPRDEVLERDGIMEIEEWNCWRLKVGSDVWHNSCPVMGLIRYLLRCNDDGDVCVVKHYSGTTEIR